MKELAPPKRCLELLTFCRRRKKNGVEFKILQMEDPIECRIAGRINRFVLKIRVRRHYYRAWINNTGRLHQFLVKGRKGFCVRNEKGDRTDYRLFSIKEGNFGAIIDTQLQMRVFEKSLEMKLVPWLKECRILKVNAKLGYSLIDYLLKCGGKEVYVEVKSAVLRQGHHSMYPDCPSRRGRKHIEELASHVKQGGKATILFIAALPGVWAFKPNRSADPKLHKLLLEAHQEGVGIKSIGMFYNPKDSFVYLSNPDLVVNVS
jgi:sugar fermentation stimulation protein A